MSKRWPTHLQHLHRLQPSFLLLLLSNSIHGLTPHTCPLQLQLFHLSLPSPKDPSFFTTHVKESPESSPFLLPPLKKPRLMPLINWSPTPPMMESPPLYPLFSLLLSLAYPLSLSGYNRKFVFFFFCLIALLFRYYVQF